MSTRAGSYEEIHLEELQQETDEGHVSQPASQLGLCSAAVPLRLIDFYFLELIKSCRRVMIWQKKKK